MESDKIMKKCMVLILTSTLFLVGCGSGGSMSELRNELEAIKSQAPRGIPPMPVYKEVSSFFYGGQSFRSPFEIPSGQVQTIVVRNNGVKPPRNHVKSQLEEYSVDSLSMLGTIGMTGNRLEALIRSPDGKLHRVKTGMYIGENFGRVIDVTQQAVSIIEIKPDGANSWIEAPRVINSKTSKNESSEEQKIRGDNV